MKDKQANKARKEKESRGRIFVNLISSSIIQVNMIFLVNIIRVLVTKLRATHANEPSQYR